MHSDSYKKLKPWGGYGKMELGFFPQQLEV